MDCIDCGNCKENEKTYYCVKEDAVIINENYVLEEVSSNTPWKKGTKEYEKHRKLFRPEPVKKEKTE